MIQTALIVELTREAAISVTGFAVLAAVVTVVAAFSYRRVTRRPVPTGAAILGGTGLVATWLTVRLLVGAPVVGDLSLVHHASAATLLGVISASTVAADGGRRLGDHLACEVYEITTLPTNSEVGAHLRAARCSVAVSLPTQIDDAAGYPPVDDGIKEALSGQTLVIPRRSSREDLVSRLTTRLERDYGVGHVAIELSDEGTIESLALGGRRAGLGSTLPPQTVAVAIRADPPADASPGDPVEIWTADEPSRLVTVGRLAGVTNDVATVIVDADDTDGWALDCNYRLLTRPAGPDDTAELVSTLRAVAETVTTVTVDAGASLAGEFAGWLPVLVLVIERDEALRPVPDDKTTIQAGDRLWVLGTPAALDRLSQLASSTGPLDPAESDTQHSQG